MRFESATIVPGLERSVLAPSLARSTGARVSWTDRHSLTALCLCSHSLIIRPDGLTLLLLFPHPALLDLPLPPFTSNLPDPAKLRIEPEQLSLDPAVDLLGSGAAGKEIGEESGGLPVSCGGETDDLTERGELISSRALGVLALVLPGGACFVLSQLAPTASIAKMAGRSSISLAASGSDVHLSSATGEKGGPSTSSARHGPTINGDGSRQSPAPSRWNVREVELWEPAPSRATAGGGKSATDKPLALTRERARAIKAGLNGRLGLLAVGSTSCVSSLLAAVVSPVSSLTSYVPPSAL